MEKNVERVCCKLACCTNVGIKQRGFIGAEVDGADLARARRDDKERGQCGSESQSMRRLETWCRSKGQRFWNAALGDSVECAHTPSLDRRQASTSGRSSCARVARRGKGQCRRDGTPIRQARKRNLLDKTNPAHHRNSHLLPQWSAVSAGVREASVKQYVLAVAALALLTSRK